MIDMILTEIDHVAIAVRDLEAAIDYYHRAFGATVAFVHPKGSFGTLIELVQEN